MSTTRIATKIASLEAPSNPNDSSAREWAQRELAKSKYHDEPSLWERIIAWLRDHLVFSIDSLSADSQAAITMIILGILLAGIIIFLIVVAVRTYLRGRASRSRHNTHGRLAPLFDDLRSAEQLFTAAEQARLHGDKRGIIVENFRGVIRLLDERGVITIRPGVTATEAATEGSTQLGQPDIFLNSAGSFNLVYFSSTPATDTAVAQVDELVAFVRSSLASKQGGER